MNFKSKAACIAAVLALYMGAAQAAPKTISIEFDGAAYANFNGGDSFNDGEFRFTAIDPWGTGFVGFGSESGSCGATYICPSRNSAYYGVVNDGALLMERADGGAFALAGFDLGFISNAFDPSLVGTIGKILVQGFGANGTTAVEFALEGLDAITGTGAFAHFDFDAAFSAMNWKQVSFTSCLDDGQGGCTAGASFNLGQFGIDGIQVIPEPASLALVGLALALGTASRRRRNA
jgi:hypothetical protein